MNCEARLHVGPLLFFLEKVIYGWSNGLKWMGMWDKKQSGLLLPNVFLSYILFTVNDY